MWRRVLAFLAMGTVLPMVAARAFWGTWYTNANTALFGAVFIGVYIVFLPLYRRLVAVERRRRWWKELLVLIWFYLAIIGLAAFIIVLF